MGAAAAVLRARLRPAAGGGRPLRRRPQGFLGYADVRIGDAARSGLGAIQQDHGRAIRDADGRRAACPRPPPVDAGVLVATDRTIPGSITRIVDGMLDRIEANGPVFDGMLDYGGHLVVDALLEAMVNMDARRKGIFTAFHDLIPGTTYVKPGEPWSPELRSAFDRTMEEIRVIIEERRVSPRPDFISDPVNARDAGDKLNDRELFD